MQVSLNKARDDREDWNKKFDACEHFDNHTPISRPTLEKNPMPGHLFEGNPVDEGTKRLTPH